MALVEIGLDFVAIHDENDEEMLYWDQQEWIDDPELPIMICSMIALVYEQGPNMLRQLLADGKRDGIAPPTKKLQTAVLRSEGN